MSFILDALKKSEMERQRQSVPGLMDAGVAAPRPRFAWWVVALVVLLAVNAGVVSLMLLRSPHPAADATARRGAPAPAPAAPSVAQMPEVAPADHFSPLDAPPVYAPEIPVAGGGEDSPPPAPKAAGVLRRPEPVLVEKAAPPAREAQGEPDEVLPTMSELNLTGAQALPELHLDVHVYATSAADRFVYVNMRKYREGSVLQEGPRVERIRRDGVVLDYQGLRFLLSRQ